MTTTETAGTPPPDGGDAASPQTTGTQGTEDRDAKSSKEPDYKKLYLEEAKPKIEEANRLKSKLTELEKLLESPATSAPAEPADNVDWNKVRVYAQGGDEVARAMLWQKEQRERDIQDIIHANQLRDMPVSDRETVYDYFLKNRHRLGDPLAAQNELNAKKLEQEVARLREENARLSQTRDTDVVRTHARETPFPQANRKISSLEEFDRIQAQLAAEGRHHERMQMQKDLAEGKIDI